MHSYRIKRFLKVVLYACLVLLVIGIFCYKNLSPIDAITSATKVEARLQEHGAIYHLMNGVSR